jgi:hypothetical protein
MWVGQAWFGEATVAVFFILKNNRQFFILVEVLAAALQKANSLHITSCDRMQTLAKR